MLFMLQVRERGRRAKFDGFTGFRLGGEKRDSACLVTAGGSQGRQSDAGTGASAYPCADSLTSRRACRRSREIASAMSERQREKLLQGCKELEPSMLREGQLGESGERGGWRGRSRRVSLVSLQGNLKSLDLIRSVTCERCQGPQSSWTGAWDKQANRNVRIRLPPPAPPQDGE